MGSQNDVRREVTPLSDNDLRTALDLAGDEDRAIGFGGESFQFNVMAEAGFGDGSDDIEDESEGERSAFFRESGRYSLMTKGFLVEAA